MMNTRGNPYSQSHANYTPMERKFWDFSIHELGVYDLPTAIDFILDKTHHPKLFYIGHSIGASACYIMLSVLPEYNEKIVAQVSLVPLYEGSPTPFLKITLPILEYLAIFLYRNTVGSLLEQNNLLARLLIFVVTKIPPFGYNAYDLALLLVLDLLPSHINWKIMPKVYSHYPAGTSTKLALHLLQIMRLQSFNNFDYGAKGNLEIYGTTSPPKYNISNIVTPTRIYHSLLDIGSSNTGVKLLHNKLPVKAGLIKISDPGFSHQDFLLNENAKKLVYDNVISFVNDVIEDTINAI